MQMQLKKDQFDFRTEGPPKRCCHLCEQDFTDWHVAPEVWQQLPEDARQLELCVEDFRLLLRESGQDPDQFPISHEAWEWRRANWEHAKDEPADCAHISFEVPDDAPVGGETMWCQVVRQQGENTYVVRLLNQGVFREDVERGDRFLAELTDTVHGITGRPLFRPVRRLPRPAARRRQRKCKSQRG
jgi:hypothetical protein